MAEGEGKISSLLVETRDRASAGQAAPAENIAKRLSASEIVAEMFEESSNPLFETLEEWERVLQAENIDFEELSP